MKISLITIVISLILLSSCSSESPQEKAKKYLGYIDSFYVDLTDEQENLVKKIIDLYFYNKSKTTHLNKKIYDHIEDSLLNNKKKLDIKLVESLIIQIQKENLKSVPEQLAMIDGFYQTLSKKQKVEVADALKSLKSKSARFRFWIGEPDKK
ncbi:MAG: hypothetical protein CME61_01045 [Halobacteriovoraceae bacterium]|nr:hypothetical protein [Halobacteriovoraceae bacterium]